MTLELDILRKIVEREGCLEALNLAMESKGRKMAVSISVLRTLVRQLRVASVEVVEMIVSWRSNTDRTEFRWRNRNYLLKMVTDLDVLAGNNKAQQVFPKIRLKHNPFLVELHLDHQNLRLPNAKAARGLQGDFGIIDTERVLEASRALVEELERTLNVKINKRRQELASKIQDDEREEMLSSEDSVKKLANGIDRNYKNEVLPTSEHGATTLRHDIAEVHHKLSVTKSPEKQRELEKRLGGLNNKLRFRKGMVYQRRNEVKQKQAAYRQVNTASRICFHHEDVVQPEDDSELEEILKEADLERERIVLQWEQGNASLAQGRFSSLIQRESKESSTSLVKQPALTSLTASEVKEYIDGLGLSRNLGKLFQTQGIDGKLLAQANDQDLVELGISIRLHRVRIMDAIKNAR